MLFDFTNGSFNENHEPIQPSECSQATRCVCFFFSSEIVLELDVLIISNNGK
jgi:hypothetical protein